MIQIEIYQNLRKSWKIDQKHKARFEKNPLML